MKYKCLVLDHDDTVVNSTAEIHFKAFSQTLKELRPNISLSLEDYFKYNFEPGFCEFCSNILQFTDYEMQYQTEKWLQYVNLHVPKAFKGIKEILWNFHNDGGHICVVSHSMRENIIRDYKKNNLPKPELVFGWECPPEKRKPSIWPIEQIIDNLSLERNEIVMIDDLKPGKIMADKAGIDFIGAGWSHSIDEISNFMRKECKYYCSSVSQLEKLL